ncbi:MAG: class I SAM-dependent methyltransferase [Chloroflexi bacterium]|nr:class I SAM-dependent methyltransferase [Chloroflexota bacterium]
MGAEGLVEPIGRTGTPRRPTLYSPNNPAKQWILEQVGQLGASAAIRVCDLACGAGSAWPAFLRANPHIAYLGVDSNQRAIARASHAFAGCANALVLVADGETFQDGAGTFDVVTALSSLEHVVSVRQFIGRAVALLKPGGRAFLNYDAGHFRQQNLKERVLVPAGQALALFGCRRYYLKCVKDDEVIRVVEELGARVVEVRKNNLDIIKRHLRDDVLTSDLAATWHEFEAKLNGCLPASVLDGILWSTTVVVERGT